ncbi:MAG: type I methionyl aminopeptidase, partial [Cyanobacteria bacterium P01_F01_bin.153]
VVSNCVLNLVPNKKKVIREGDVLKVDTGAFFNGFHGDSCVTILVGEVSDEAKRLSQVAEESLFAGINQVKAGATLLDLAIAIEKVAKSAGYSIVEDFTGHGVGRNLHEEPAVFNYRTRSIPKVKLRAGMTLAIEPILNAGKKTTKILGDRWTAVTTDRSLSAQWEHTVLVTKNGYEILTDRTKV